MTARTSLWWFAVPGAALACYGLHRLCLRLEERGLLYYIHRKPEGGAGGGFAALQQIVEPGTKHVFRIKEEKRGESEEGAPGSGGWAPGESPFAVGNEPRE